MISCSLFRGTYMALADCQRLLGDDHPTTNAVRGNLAAMTRTPTSAAEEAG